MDEDRPVSGTPDYGTPPRSGANHSTPAKSGTRTGYQALGLTPLPQKYKNGRSRKDDFGKSFGRKLGIVLALFGVPYFVFTVLLPNQERDTHNVGDRAVSTPQLATPRAPTPAADQSPIAISTGTPLSHADGTVGPAPIIYSGNGNAVFDIDKPARGPGYITITEMSASGSVSTYYSDGSPDTDEFLRGALPVTFGIDLPGYYAAPSTPIEVAKVSATGAWTLEVHAISDAPVITGSEASGHGSSVFLWAGPTGTAHLVAEAESVSSFFTYDLENAPYRDFITNESATLDTKRPWPRTGVLVAVSTGGPWSISVTPDAP